MTPEEAIEKLGFHSGRDSRIEDPRWKTGILSTLRPYDGTLKTDAMDEVLACVLALSEMLDEGDTIPRDVMSDLWAIVHLGRLWGTDEGGMLRRNNLISDADLKTLDGWLDSLSLAVLSFLDHAPDSAIREIEGARKRLDAPAPKS